MVHFLLVPYFFASCTGKNRKVKFHQCSVYRDQPEKLFKALKFLNKNAFEDEFKNVDRGWLVELLYLRVCENVLLVINDSLMHMGKPRVQVKRFWLKKPQGRHPGVFNLKKLLKKLYHVTGIILLARDTGGAEKRKKRHKKRGGDSSDTKANNSATVEETTTVTSSNYVIGDQKHPKSSDEGLTSDYEESSVVVEAKGGSLAEIIETQPEPEPEKKFVEKVPKSILKKAAEISDDPGEFGNDSDDKDDDDAGEDDDAEDDDLDILEFKDDDVNSDATLDSEERRMWDTDIKHREKDDEDEEEDPFAF
uniref:Uncharacterized protein n=1 Tax=Lotharella oceanica TaxID=641309 RepID=A0A7S2TXV4_9EUKA|mmetsp:Transcript_32090/g.59741  ORF Transcript_32090/g.59741 Transcript_32090/m.59741 type:complete len:307 (+) Transcript_32090:123-1043(+)